MHIKTVQVVWHSRKPVLSLDFHTNSRLVTGGADATVRVWRIKDSDDDVTVEHLADLTTHLGSVNVVRFSPDRRVLATGADDSKILLWENTSAAPEKEGGAPGAAGGKGEEGAGEGAGAAGAATTTNTPFGAAWGSAEGESWRITKMLIGHSADVYDISWLASGDALVSGSVDNNVLLWRMGKEKPVSMIRDSDNYVQGVAFDPFGEFFLSHSVDRTLRIYRARAGTGSMPLLEPVAAGTSDAELAVSDDAPKFALPAYRKKPLVLRKALYNTSRNGNSEAGGASNEAGSASKTTTCKRYSMWADEATSTFFRRLAVAPDGSIVVVPTGVYKESHGADKVNTTYVLPRHELDTPIMHLPSPEMATVAVRFCPHLFELNEAVSETPAALPLPYRMVFAVASIDTVTVYETQTMRPVALVSNVHCAAITDLAWSPNARYLAVASQDGYVTLLKFGDGELGTFLPEAKYPARLRRVRAALGITAATDGVLKTMPSAAPKPAPVANILVPRKKAKKAPAANQATTSPGKRPREPAAQATSAAQSTAGDAVVVIEDEEDAPPAKKAKTLMAGAAASL
ncbi:chromatin assembly factor 1 subunit B [Thecamonas trahens ATCC 50062]|uniref:Chromatin assembly factor 1 subunit B n=1 Tax=Thecamonas trahens ATCC 50062 TaxID=461836 RepID=A0A0L0DR98_THETB|nr:chromatin assembly factor 1 subunit B [Thecamonas trahens ATCC 50062]KNC54541.1 chromatin assembly factor 1 subunit B [Thecamonas trahens ATCC 50062]|eukprot:XP_013753557.1 chromatin assembly factor 1 subunit B [Thecamonas trahens ATCC 50062]